MIKEFPISFCCEGRSALPAVAVTVRLYNNERVLVEVDIFTRGFDDIFLRHGIYLFGVLLVLVPSEALELVERYLRRLRRILLEPYLEAPDEVVLRALQLVVGDALF